MLAISRSRVDPRGRGGAMAAWAGLVRESGRSPRARGSPYLSPRRVAPRGSIPAGAGEPPVSSVNLRPYRVDPRGRGGAYVSAVMRSPSQGRSPRARGSPAKSLCWFGRLRSIPAGAGEPAYRPGRCPRHQVDPRGRGGAYQQGTTTTSQQGRSPRARGSPYPSRTLHPSFRSIPAGAGEPLPVAHPPSELQVDPRGRGGADSPLRVAPKY